MLNDFGIMVIRNFMKSRIIMSSIEIEKVANEHYSIGPGEHDKLKGVIFSQDQIGIKANMVVFD